MQVFLGIRCFLRLGAQPEHDRLPMPPLKQFVAELIGRFPGRYPQCSGLKGSRGEPERSAIRQFVDHGNRQLIRSMQIRQEGETIAAASHRRENFQSMDEYPIDSRCQTVRRRADGTAGRLQDRDFPARIRGPVDAEIDRPGLKTNHGKPAKFAPSKKGPQEGKHAQPFVMSAAIRFFIFARDSNPQSRTSALAPFISDATAHNMNDV